MSSKEQTHWLHGELLWTKLVRAVPLQIDFFKSMKTVMLIEELKRGDKHAKDMSTKSQYY